MDNFFNIEKLISKFAADTPTIGGMSKDDKLASGMTNTLKRQQTLPGLDNNEYNSKAKKDMDFLNSNNILLTKSLSTSHIPDNARAKNSKRVYANFDKELSCKMFGYRVNFVKKEMKLGRADTQASQAHKPIVRFTADVVNLLTKDYGQIHRYHSKQRILIPVNESDEEECLSPKSGKSPRKSPDKEQSDEDDD